SSTTPNAAPWTLRGTRVVENKVQRGLAGTPAPMRRSFPQAPDVWASVRTIGPVATTTQRATAPSTVMFVSPKGAQAIALASTDGTIVPARACSEPPALDALGDPSRFIDVLAPPLVFADENLDSCSLLESRSATSRTGWMYWSAPGIDFRARSVSAKSRTFFGSFWAAPFWIFFIASSRSPSTYSSTPSVNDSHPFRPASEQRSEIGPLRMSWAPPKQPTQHRKLPQSATRRPSDPPRARGRQRHREPLAGTRRAPPGLSREGPRRELPAPPGLRGRDAARRRAAADCDGLARRQEAHGS